MHARLVGLHLSPDEPRIYLFPCVAPANSPDARAVLIGGEATTFELTDEVGGVHLDGQISGRIAVITLVVTFAHDFDTCFIPITVLTLVSDNS